MQEKFNLSSGIIWANDELTAEPTQQDGRGKRPAKCLIASVTNVLANYFCIFTQLLFKSPSAGRVRHVRLTTRESTRPVPGWYCPQHGLMWSSVDFHLQFAAGSSTLQLLKSQPFHIPSA